MKGERAGNENKETSLKTVTQTEGDELGPETRKQGLTRRNSTARVPYAFRGPGTHVPLPQHREFWKQQCSGDGAEGRSLRCLLLLLPGGLSVV